MHTIGELPNLFFTKLRKDQVLEILVKIIISLVIIVYLTWTWTHQIDPIEKFKRFFTEKTKKQVNKIIISLVAIVFLTWIWTHQIDPIETFKQLIRGRAEDTVDWIVTRKENSIYQGGEEVGKVIGEIKEVDGNFMFQEFHNSLALDSNKTFEYRRHIYRIIQVETIAPTASTEHGMVSGYMKNILCERIENLE